MVISAPTGSGKTVLFELCMLRLLSRYFHAFASVVLRKIYIAPSKALVQEKLRDWNHKLGSWGINCLELTGDNESYNIRNIQEADVIVTTPEKFDAVTRYRIKDGGLSFFSDIALVVIDEVHLLNDPRGAALEAIVSRIKLLARNPEMKSSTLSCVRFLAVSATIPNIGDLAEWLMVPFQGIKRFGEEMRPVKLTTKVFGYTPAKNDFLFEKSLFDELNCYLILSDALPVHSIIQRLQNYIFDLLLQYSRGKSALIFCSTRKGAQEAAQRLSQIAMTFGHSNPFIKGREQQERLREASLSCSDKQMQSYILYGIGYHNGGLSLKDRNLIEGLFLKGDLQVLCTTNTLAHGVNLPAHTVVIKSTQHFNKEKGLYMEYDRSMVLQKPENYAIKKGIPGDRLEKHIQEICVQKVNELSRNQMIWTDEDGFLLKPLEPGRLMTKYYLRFNTMKNIMLAPASCSIEDALHIICQAEEFSWIQLRRNEKKLLSDANTDKDGRLRFHILGDKGKRKKRIQSREEKIFVLANDCLTGDPSLHDLSMSQDMNSLCSNGCRIAKCMKEYFIYRKNYKGALNSALLAKKCSMQALHSMGVKSFETLYEADPRKIEIVTGRKYPFGNHIKDSLLSLPPKIEMKIEETQCQKQGKSKLVVTLTRLSESAQSTKRHYADMVVAVEEDNLILFHEKIRVDEFSSPYSTTLLVSIPQQEKLTAKADLIFEEFIGIDLHEKYIVRKVIDSNVIPKHGIKHLSRFPQPKDVCVIEVDNEYTSCAPTEKRRISNKSKQEIDFMPSFNLLDEDLEEAEPSIETGDSDCKIITPTTVFDHIREKAKSFPSLAASGNAGSPPSEALLFIRKRTRETRHEHNNAIEVSEQTEGNKFPHSSQLLPSSECKEQVRHDIEKTTPPTPPICFDEDSDLMRTNAFAEGLQAKDDVVFQRSSGTFGRHDQTSFEIPALSNQMPNNNFSLESQGSFICSPIVSRSQCYSEPTAKEIREVDSFLGFKSVFSFL
ncbi:DNA helicase ROCK-N-ROLLERS [Actinidia rufa]|uniref:DNA helicase ROCK-N-ROLLERS n=1 Tax=Actinidia rufa TaxID=165716 RepID=A0A7J0EAC1_9ERIC|nr:DNA helicase ROCK-N-ROLLERS [Actinidia rufa]